MGSGVSQKTQQSQQALADQQVQSSKTYADLAQKSLGKMDTLTAPQIGYDTSLINAANSGDFSKLMQAFAPQQSVISEQLNAAKANIANTTAPGAGQDAALANLPIAAGTATASGLNSAYSGALKDLTSIGSAYGGTGLQEAGAGISSGSAAGQTLNTEAQSQAQGKASTMGLLGSLAGAGGHALSGAFHFGSSGN